MKAQAPRRFHISTDRRVYLEDRNGRRRLTGAAAIAVLEEFDRRQAVTRAASTIAAPVRQGAGPSVTIVAPRGQR